MWSIDNQASLEDYDDAPIIAKYTELSHALAILLGDIAKPSELSPRGLAILCCELQQQQERYLGRFCVGVEPLPMTRLPARLFRDLRSEGALSVVFTAAFMYKVARVLLFYLAPTPLTYPTTLLLYHHHHRNHYRRRCRLFTAFGFGSEKNGVDVSSFWGRRRGSFA